MEKIVKKEKNGKNNEFFFEDGAWVNVNLSGEFYEYQKNPQDGDSYIEGELELIDENSTPVLVGYDGCFELPEEVIEGCRDLGVKIDL